MLLNLYSSYFSCYKGGSALHHNIVQAVQSDLHLRVDHGVQHDSIKCSTILLFPYSQTNTTKSMDCQPYKDAHDLLCNHSDRKLREWKTGSNDVWQANDKKKSWNDKYQYEKQKYQQTNKCDKYECKTIENIWNIVIWSWRKLQTRDLTIC